MQSGIRWRAAPSPRSSARAGRAGGKTAYGGEMRLDSVVQGLGLVVISLGLTFALFVLITTAPEDTTLPRPARQHTLCHVRDVRLVRDGNGTPTALHLGVGLALRKISGELEEHTRYVHIEARPTGCDTIDSCLSKLQISSDEPFGCLYDAAKHIIDFVPSSFSPVDKPEASDGDAIEGGEGRQGWLLFLLASMCLCTPLCFIIGVVSLAEGLGIPLPRLFRCFDTARCAIQERMHRIQLEEQGRRSAEDGVSPVV